MGASKASHFGEMWRSSRSSGEIQTRAFVAKDGAEKSVTEIRVHRIARLDRAPKPGSTEEAAAWASPPEIRSGARSRSAGTQHCLASRTAAPNEDDTPF